MTKEKIKELKVGDRILVRAVHYREGWKKVERNIVKIDHAGNIGVRLFTWNPFWLRPNEIIEKV